MLFNSIEFFIFLPIIVLVYFLFQKKLGKKSWIVILLASYYFYMSLKPEYVILIIVSTLVNYFAAIYIGKTKNIQNKKLILALAVIYNIGMLVLFKYFNFFNETIVDFFKLFSISFEPALLNLVLPIGISFYTFQALGYVIDVYRGKTNAEKRLGIMATYVAFFPTVLAGPIERAKNLMPQIIKSKKFDWKMAGKGFRLFLFGLFLKVVIADRLGIVVNTIYGSPTEYTGIPLMLATFFFSFQIYADFAAYSSMAIGVAKILGFNLMENFRRPYLAKSFTEFWRRWHISLSTWFRDYVYFSLGGNKVKIPRWYLNLFIVFIASGLWHGANITFILWGALHGAYIIVEKIPKNFLNPLREHTTFLGKRFWGFVATIFTFIFATIAWVFFRANNVSDAFYILTNFFSGWSTNLSNIRLGGIGGINGLIFAFVLIGLLILFEIVQEKKGIEKHFLKIPLLGRLILYLVLITVIIFFGVTGAQFIYFGF
ncbi:MAG: MBOAT family protein [Candidatus Diapherotrites archaeon]|nr:MBOAT family protein [Candidatus Diapherotrites archaeon]